MEKQENRKNFSFPHLYLVEGAKNWKKEKDAQLKKIK